MAVLWINGDLGRAAAVERTLNAIENSYNGLYTFEVITDRRYLFPYSFDEVGPPQRWRLFSSPLPVRPSTALVERRDFLVLREGQFTSPGFWKVLGALILLETIREFLNDHHRRSQDHRYRERLEEERITEEIERMRLDRVAEGTRQLRDLGLPEPVIRQFVAPLVLRPLRALEDAQNGGLLSTAELESLPERTTDEPEPPA